jgi:predicted secreted hydrolase
MSLRLRWLPLVTGIALSATVAPNLPEAPYREALPGYRFSFPRDHFEHPEYRTEWWYYTGNVWSKDGRRFGFELVFFREGQRVGARDNPSTWRVDDVYVAHAALTDVDGKRFLSHERMNRAGPGIAGASFAGQRVWNGNWSAVWNGERQVLSAVAEDFSFHFDASPSKPFVIQGEDGVSRKAEGLGHASHYVSFPRLALSGSIHEGARNYSVSGQAWMDHEWFTHELQPGQIGWDWFSVQLDNQTELMLFDLRRGDGRPEPASSGTYIARDGTAKHLKSGDFKLLPSAWWQSPKTGARYPIAWSISVPAYHLQLDCRAKLHDQELAVTRGPRYWEGAVDYSGSQQGTIRHGVGYLEMTGYDSPIKLD